MLYTILGIVIVIVSFSLYLFGIIFIYQTVVSVLYSVVFTLICIFQDRYITEYFEKVGFILISSR